MGGCGRIGEKTAGESRRWSGGDREKVNLIGYNNKERSLLEVKRGRGGRGNERRGELLAAAEKAVFGLAGLTYSRRYTATMMFLYRYVNAAAAVPRSAFC